MAVSLGHSRLRRCDPGTGAVDFSSHAGSGTSVPAVLHCGVQPATGLAEDRSFSPAPPGRTADLGTFVLAGMHRLARSTESRTSERVRKFLVWPERYRSVYYGRVTIALLPRARRLRPTYGHS